MTKNKYYPPSFSKGQYHCPHCGVYAKQKWSHLKATGDNFSTFGEFSIVRHKSNIYDVAKTSLNLPEFWTVAVCEHCNKITIWNESTMIFPKNITIDQPNNDLSHEIQNDYLEAANIFNDSPRAAAALLRLALQKLCIQLGEKGTNIFDDIGSLVKKGLNPLVQKSLDSLRITGNNAVHPGQINLMEEPERVIKLFELLNFIAEKMLTEPKELENFYEALPEEAKKVVEKRDRKK